MCVCEGSVEDGGVDKKKRKNEKSEKMIQKRDRKENAKPSLKYK